MYRWLKRLFARDEEIAKLESRIAILTLERDLLLQAHERNRLRVEAEAKAAAANIIDAERRIQ